jgi:uncharacterized membrane protein YcaP (DUF421 family)
MFFEGWYGIVRVIVVGTLAYAALVVLLRVSGKRTLAKLNAFDFVVTVALGSILATVLLSEDVALVEGVAAFALLVGLQWLIAWLSVRSPFVSRSVKSDPTLLLYRGQMLHSAMQQQRVTQDEVLSAVRGGGWADYEVVHAVVLETDGSLSVVASAPDASDSALPYVPELPSPPLRWSEGTEGSP